MELSSKKDIENISIEILKGSKSLDIFPTPVERIVQYAELTVAQGGLDLTELERKHGGFKITDVLRSGLSKVRGFLDRKEKIIYVDISQGYNRQTFVKLHETGHGVLPWQHEILQFLDDDDTLDPDMEEQFEAEANYFASITLFQNDRFIDQIGKYELGIPAAIAMSKHFGASIHATLRRYVEQSNKRCALLVLQNATKAPQAPSAQFRNAFYSRRFAKEFGNIKWPEEFGYKWEFVKDCYHQKKLKQDGEITLSTKNGFESFRYHFFNNSFNPFVLFFPNGENKRTKTKIIVQNQSDSLN